MILQIDTLVIYGAGGGIRLCVGKLRNAMTVFYTDFTLGCLTCSKRVKEATEGLVI
jgi:hypothetical protein